MQKQRKISKKKMTEMVKLFSEDIDATKVSRLVGVSRNTVNVYYNAMRTAIVTYQNTQMKVISGIFEADESYFGATRVRGKRGRGAYGKIPVFGLLKRDGNVFVQVITNASKQEIIPLIKRNVRKGSTIYTDSWKAYDGLIFDGYKHKRIKHCKNQFALGTNHINGIESFWSFAKRRMRKFNGIAKHKFAIHLKECEFRFNHRKKNIFIILLKMLNIRLKVLV